MGTQPVTLRKDRAGNAHDFKQADDGNQARILEQADKGIEQRGDHGTQGLGQYDQYCGLGTI